ncbi:MAG: hypothetical protein Q7R59_01035 [bacterium]|nr:hypothetical protein [bacterium]
MSISAIIPDYVFDEAWLRGPFVSPEDKGERAALRLQLEAYSCYGIMFMPNSDGVNFKWVRNVLLERIEILTPRQKKATSGQVKKGDISVPPHILFPEWREGNYTLHPNHEIRRHCHGELAKCVDAPALADPRHAATRKVVQARLAAHEAYEKALAK